MELTLVAGRSKKEVTLAIGGTWLVFSFALSLALPQPPNPRHVVLGMLAGAVVIIIGFLAASRCRLVLRRTRPQRVKLAVLSLLAGTALGAGLLGVLLALASVEPSLHARFAGRLSEPFWRPWALAFESSILEEVMFRFFAMSVVAWITARLIKRAGVAFVIALIVSTLLFGLAHLPAWLSLTHASAALIGSVLLLNGFGGLLFGWIFWRWGLAYAVLCHLAGDVVIKAFGPRLLA